MQALIQYYFYKKLLWISVLFDDLINLTKFKTTIQLL